MGGSEHGYACAADLGHERLGWAVCLGRVKAWVGG